MINNNKYSYLVRIDLEEDDVKEIDLEPGEYLVTVRPDDNRVQVVRKDENRQYFVAYDENREDYCTVDELMEGKDELCNIVRGKLMLEMV